MIKTLDILAISIILMILSFIWTYYLVKSIWLAVIISILFYILIWAVLKINNQKHSKTYNSKKLSKHLALMGQDYSVKLIYDNIISEDKKIVDDKYILIGNKQEIIYPIYKFSNVGYENISQIYQIARKNNIKKVYILSNGVDRNAVVLANGLNVKFEYITIDVIFKYLKNNNKLPTLLEISDKQITKINIKQILNKILAHNNSKYYIFSGILFGLISFISPSKTYYVVLSSITLILAILTFLPFNKELNETSDPSQSILKNDFEKKYLNNVKQKNNDISNKNKNENK